MISVQKGNISSGLTYNICMLVFAKEFAASYSNLFNAERIFFLADPYVHLLGPPRLIFTAYRIKIQGIFLQVTCKILLPTAATLYQDPVLVTELLPTVAYMHTPVQKRRKYSSLAIAQIPPP
jgi:hypothetical protein